MNNKNDLVNSEFIGATSKKLYLACSYLAIVILAIDVVVPLGIVVGVAYIAVIWLSLRSPENRFTLGVAAVCTIFVAIGYWGSPDSDAPDYIVYSNRALTVFSIWVSTIMVLKQRNQDHQLYQQSLQIEQTQNKAEVQKEKLKVLRSTMLTVQDIMGNFLNNLQYFKLEIERNKTLSEESSNKLNELIEDTSNRLNKLGNLTEIREKKMAGDMTGIDYESVSPVNNSINNPNQKQFLYSQSL